MHKSILQLAVAAMLLINAQTVSGQIIGTQTDLLDDSTTFSTENLEVRRYVTLPNSVLDRQETRFIISLTTQPGDNAAFYTSSQDGRIHRVVDDGGGQGVATEWFNVNASIAVEQDNTFHGGLRSIAFHPDFADDSKDGYGKFYGSLVAEARDSGANFLGTSGGVHESVVAEWTYDFNATAVNPSSYRELFRIRNPQLDHPIKQLTFNQLADPTHDDYGLLYVAQGDGSILAQSSGTGLDTTEALGKILRVNPLQQGSSTYTTPGNALASDGDSSTLAEIYSYGHRNPHHLTFGADSFGSHHLITAEVGQDLIDEINLPVNGGNFGWSAREGTFVKIPDNENGRGYGIRPAGDPGTSTGDSGRVVPLDDDGNEFIYPALQLDHNDPTDGNRFGVAGGPVVGGRYYYSVFAGNNVRPGGQIYSVALDDLANQKTSFDLSAGEDTSDLTWIDDHVQHRLEFDHDNDASTAPILYDDFAQLLNADRSDIRFGVTPAGDMLLSSKRTGEVYLVTNNFTPEVGVLLAVDLASGQAILSNQSTVEREIDGYTIMSPGGALDPNDWDTLESQGIDDGDWVASPGLTTALSELQMFGSTTLDETTGIHLGTIYSGGAQDLEFNFLLDNNEEPTMATVQYMLGGDFNDDGIVSAQDYIVWRDNLGSSVALPNDMTPGSVDESDYALWRMNFGATLAGSASVTSSNPVPEPSAICIALFAYVAVLLTAIRQTDYSVFAVHLIKRRASAMAAYRTIGFLVALAIGISVVESSAEAQSIQLAFGDRAGSLYTTGTDGVVDAGGVWNATGAGAGLNAPVDQFGTILDSLGVPTSVTLKMGIDNGGTGTVDYGVNPNQSAGGGGGVFNNGLWENWIFTRNNDNLFVRLEGLLAGEYDVYALVREPNQLGRTYDAYLGTDAGSSADDEIGDLTSIGVGTNANDQSSLDELEDFFTSTITLNSGDALVLAIDPTNEQFATLEGMQIVSTNVVSPCDDYAGCFALVSEHLFLNSTAGPFEGDFNNDGIVNFKDFRQIKQQFLSPTRINESATIPEPATIWQVLIIGIAALPNFRFALSNQ